MLTQKHKKITLHFLKKTFQLTGILPDSEENAKLACEKFKELGCKSVVITRAEKGACCYDSMTSHFSIQKSYFVEDSKVLDRIGVGDCFVGSLTYLVSVGTPLVDAVKIANYLASLSLTKSGGTNLHENKFPEKTAILNFKF